MPLDAVDLPGATALGSVWPFFLEAQERHTPDHL